MGHKTKFVYIALTLRVPQWMTKRQAAREVRTLINHQSGYLCLGPNDEEFEVKASQVKAISFKERDPS